VTWTNTLFFKLQSSTNVRHLRPDLYCFADDIRFQTMKQ